MVLAQFLKIDSSHIFKGFFFIIDELIFFNVINVTQLFSIEIARSLNEENFPKLISFTILRYGP